MVMGPTVGEQMLHSVTSQFGNMTAREYEIAARVARINGGYSMANSFHELREKILVADPRQRSIASTWKDLPAGYAPMQGTNMLRPHQEGYRDPGMVEWAEHVEIWNAYAKQYGTEQSAVRMAERGGFGFDEAAKLTGTPPKTWLARP